MALQVKFLASALVLVIMLLAADSPIAGTVTRTYPDLSEHVRMLVKLPLGMTQK